MTHQKLNLQLLFQLADLETEGGLRDPQNLGGSCEALLLAYGNEIFQLAEIHAILMASRGRLYRREPKIMGSQRLYPVRHGRNLSQDSSAMGAILERYC